MEEMLLKERMKVEMSRSRKGNLYCSAFGMEKAVGVKPTQGQEKNTQTDRRIFFMIVCNHTIITLLPFFHTNYI